LGRRHKIHSPRSVCIHENPTHNAHTEFYTTIEATNTPFIIAHEFFDALPIHAFQSIPIPIPPRQSLTLSTTQPSPPTRPPTPTTRNEWRELLVSPTAPPSILNPPKTAPPEFELTLAKAGTHHSRLLPALSPRYEALLPRAGSTVEISPQTQTITTYLTELITGTPQVTLPPLTSSSRTNSRTRTPPQMPAPITKPAPSGAALIIDYGPSDTIPINSLRGIRAHKLTSPFEAPGEVDLSVDVDFGAIVEVALGASEKVEVHGPVEQGDWLEGMGGRERLEALVGKAGVGMGDGMVEKEEVVKRLKEGWERLTGRGSDGMGRLYKVLAVVPERGGKRPVGFGGDV